MIVIGSHVIACDRARGAIRAPAEHADAASASRLQFVRFRIASILHGIVFVGRGSTFIIAVALALFGWSGIKCAAAISGRGRVQAAYHLSKHVGYRWQKLSSSYSS